MIEYIDGLDTAISTKRDCRVTVSDWGDGGTWLRIGHPHGDTYTSFTPEETRELISALELALKGNK